ncbi:MAG: hypothetical protein KBS62_02495 [Oscillospiraceae bacterium]|nr:hypothetical protein [Candidatus Ruminococcus equi]
MAKTLTKSQREKYKKQSDDMRLAVKLHQLLLSGEMEVLPDFFELLRNIEKNDMEVISRPEGENDIKIFAPENFKFAHDFNKKVRKWCAEEVRKYGSHKMLELYERTLLFDAPYDFDCAIRYAEFRRDPQKRFYEPRRKQLLPIVQELQRLEDDELDLLCISCPPGVGKTTLAEFYLCWQALKHPELSILGGSHSNSFLRGVYDELNRMLDPNGEYNWRKIFPQITYRETNAKDMRIDLGAGKRFQTLEFSSIGSGNAGKVRASNLLYCDDLIPDLETALSRDRLDKIVQQYTTDLRQRKIGNCKELHIATRWSVHDVIGILHERYEKDERAKFLTFSALDENDESNFDYPYDVGFSTKFFKDQREALDKATWEALYQNNPIEREGLLYPIDELKRYLELPSGEPDAILGVCDTKTTGADYCVMPIAYQFGDDFFIEDCVCENYAPDIVENSLVNKIVEHNPHIVQFESNVAGGKLAQVVQERVKKRECKSKITSKWTQANKETKIQVESPFIKQHCYFKDDSILDGEKNKEYRSMLQMLTTYTMAGKNKHDDVPDAFAQLSIFVQGINGNKVKIVKRPF